MAEERKIVGIKCNACTNQFKMYVPQNGGVTKVTCPHCKNVMAINFGTQKNTSEEDSKQQAEPPKKTTKDFSDFDGGGMQRGKLVQIRGFLRTNVSHPLKMGDNIIGQYDLEKPSNIMIKDNTISRQSVNIKVDYDEGTLDYRLCLLRSKNPVLLNGNPVQLGEERYLKFGDTIVLGQTNFRFEKA